MCAAWPEPSLTGADAQHVVHPRRSLPSCAHLGDTQSSTLPGIMRCHFSSCLDIISHPVHPAMALGEPGNTRPRETLCWVFPAAASMRLQLTPSRTLLQKPVQDKRRPRPNSTRSNPYLLQAPLPGLSRPRAANSHAQGRVRQLCLPGLRPRCPDGNWRSLLHQPRRLLR